MGWLMVVILKMDITTGDIEFMGEIVGEPLFSGRRMQNRYSA